MKWATSISQPVGHKTTLEAVFRDCVQELLGQLGDRADLVCCFIAPQFLTNYQDVPDLAGEYFERSTFLGCSAGGIIGGGVEIEQTAAISMIAASMPGVDIASFHLHDDDLPDLDAPQGQWEQLVSVSPRNQPAFILLPDPFSFRIDVLTQGLDFAFPGSVKVGGLASGAHRSGMNALFLNNHIYRSGCIGVALGGDLVVDTIVAQGCKPVGWPLSVTRAEKNFLFELDGQPALNALYEVLEDMSDRDKELAKNSLFLGVVMNEFQEQFSQGDFLIRNILGLEPKSGALLVGEILRNSQTVQFHVRDADTSADDLRHLLERYRQSRPGAAAGALLFSCLGRGQHLYGRPNHDSDCFHEVIGQIPLGGFFCNGEIGPVGGTTFLHGYTSSFGIFRPK